MMDIIVIKDIPGFTKGKSYCVISGDPVAGTVCIKGDDSGNYHLQLDVDCIIPFGKYSKNPDLKDMMLSYGQAIEACGGDARRFMNEIKKMTVGEMMDILAPNGVRFCHVLSHMNKKDLESC